MVPSLGSTYSREKTGKPISAVMLTEIRPTIWTSFPYSDFISEDIKRNDSDVIHCITMNGVFLLCIAVFFTLASFNNHSMIS